MLLHQRRSKVGDRLVKAVQQLYWASEGVSELVVCIVPGLMLQHREDGKSFSVCGAVGLQKAQFKCVTGVM